MTFLLVAAVWFGLASVVCLLFAALVRGGRSEEAEAEDDQEVSIPQQRVAHDGSRSAVST